MQKITALCNSYFLKYSLFIDVESLSTKALKQVNILFLMRACVCMISILAVSVQLLIAAPGHGQDMTEKKITLGLQNENLADALDKIGKLSGFRMGYSPDQVNRYTITTLEKEKRTVEKTIQLVLAGTDLEFKHQSDFILIFKKRPEQSNTNSGNDFQKQHSFLIIKGRITDETGKPLPGASVQLKDGSAGTNANENGEFELAISEDEGVLLISFVGYNSEEIKFNKNVAALNIVLKPAVSQNQEVIVVGYGTQKKINLTGAVVSVNAKQIENRAAADVSGILTGQAPGLTIIQSGGNPGRNTGSLNIRGIGTLNNTDPLIVVDGIPTGSLTDINPADVESISILKDAASASIYGVRASNGVILITTKRGNINGKRKITFSHQTGFTKLIKFPSKVNSTELAILHNQANVNDGTPVIFSNADIQKFTDGSSPLTHANTDHIGLLFSNGLWNAENLSIAGGTEKGAYNVSLGYIHEGGILNQTGLQKYTARINLDSRLSRKLNVGLNFAGTLNKVKDPAAGMNWVTHTAFREWANDVLQFPDGRWANPVWSDREHNAAAYNSDEMGKAASNDVRLLATGFAEYEIVKGLKAKGTVSILHDFNKASRLIRGVDLYKIDPVTGVISSSTSSDNTNLQKGSSLVDMVSRDYLDNNEMNYQFLLNYENKFGNHDIGGLLGFEQREKSAEISSLSRRKLLSDALDQVNAADPAEDFAAGSIIDFRLRSLFGRINYSYDNRYLLEANVRYDGSSRFGEEFRYDYFPSVSAGWRISNEKFFKISFINEFKLRGSWGKLGNQEVGDYRYLSTYALNGFYYLNNQQVSAIIEGPLANTQLTWEKTTSKNLGLDLAMFRNKFSISADYFIRNTNDILLAVPQPAILGAAGPVINAGSVQNKGFEIDVAYRDKAGNINYNVRVNFSKVDNKITDLAGTDRPGFKVGDPLNNLFGYEAQGLFQSQDDITKHADQSALGVPMPGDIKYADLDNNGVINADDRKNLGSLFPGINYGVSLGADYNGFDLSMVWQGVADANVLGGGRFIQPFWFGASPLKYQTDSWTTDNTDAKYPRVSFTNSSNYTPSSYWLQNTAYLKLRNLQIGYTLNNKITSRLKLSKARIYVSGENLLTITSFDYGFDPEDVQEDDPVSLFNAGSRNYPTTKRFLVGISLTF